MPWSEIVKVKPQVDSSSLNSMERTLNQRFQRIAKKFGGGLMSAIKGGGLTALAVGIVDKILNPLQEVQKSIDQALGNADDLATYAQQFNTTAGSLARLQAFGQATGLDSEGVRMLLGKFQQAVANAAGDPSKPSAVSAFVGKKDTAEGFFEFVQSLQKLNRADPNAANRVQQEVFGGKQILKASEFLNADFKDLAIRLGGPSAETMTEAAKYLAFQKDEQDLNRARRGLVDIEKKASALAGKDGKGRAFQLMELREQIEFDRENKRLGSYNDLARISMATDKMVKLLEDAYLQLAPALSKIIPALVGQLSTSAKVVEKSRAIRGMISGKGKGE